MESSRGECERRIGEIKSSVGRICELTGGLLGVRSKELVQRRQRSGCRTSKRMRLVGETRKDMMISASRPGRLDGEKLAKVRGLRGLKSVISKRCYFVVDALRDF